MASVEDLIDELFSDEEIKNTLRTSSNNSQNPNQFTKLSIDAKRKMHDWDDDNDDNCNMDDKTNRKLKLKAHDLSESPSRHAFDEVQSNNCEGDITSNTNKYKIMKANADLCDDKTICDQGVMCARNGHYTLDNSSKQESSLNFDSDSECECREENITSNSIKEMVNGDKDDKKTHCNNNNNISCQPTNTSHTSHWDEEEEEEELLQKNESENGRKINENESSSCSDKYAVMFTVPFPPSPPSEVSASAKCANRCYVTSMPSSSSKKQGNPTVLQLRALRNTTRATFALQRDKERLIARGAFYVIYPRWGNGCCDKSLMDGNEYGGCPFMLCLRCNYGVIRLQDAEWCDDDGRIDLYLTTRNYYPDWSRLASTTAVGVEQWHADSTNTSDEHNHHEIQNHDECNSLEHTEKFVLKQSVSCAAYCCQCSWLTVKSERACIETKLTDAIAYKYDDGHLTHHTRSLFATVLPLPADETRRPPLWVCRGHITAIEASERLLYEK